MVVPAPRPRILVVDDEEAMLEVFTEALERTGVEVVAESDPRRAADSIRRGDAYDVAILDLHLPFVDGHALLEIIRQRQPGVPVIIVTGYPCAQSAQRCRDLGVLHYMRKPFDPAELVGQVRRALSKQVTP